MGRPSEALRSPERRTGIKYNAISLSLRSLRADVTKCEELRAAILKTVRMGELAKEATGRNIRSSMENDAVTSLPYLSMSSIVCSFV